jgi:hypothetical protein
MPTEQGTKQAQLETALLAELRLALATGRLSGVERKAFARS